jgi:Mg-chelatase subunit ChlD
MERHGKLDRCELCYTLKPGTGAGVDITPTVIDVGGPAGSGALDLIFCIDVTSSMGDDINQVKAAAASIVDTVASDNEDYRVAIIAFRDWGDDPVFEDYLFSTDKATIVENINSLTVSGGGDTPEAVYEALMRAIDSTSVGGWRRDVNKQVILMGDAPPHDPGRNGETAPAVAKAAEEADPVVIQAVAVALGGEFDAAMVTAFRELADLTAGNYFEAADASEVPEVLQKTIRESVKAPIRMPPLPMILLAGGGVMVLGAAGALILVLSTGKAASGASAVAAAAAPAWSPEPPKESFNRRPVGRPEGAPEQFSSPKKPSGPPETL